MLLKRVHGCSESKTFVGVRALTFVVDLGLFGGRDLDDESRTTFHVLTCGVTGFPPGSCEFHTFTWFGCTSVVVNVKQQFLVNLEENTPLQRCGGSVSQAG